MKARKLITALALMMALGVAVQAQATEEYAIDKKGQHAFIQFKIKHLGYSWMLGGFNDFDGSFSYDEKNPANNKAQVVIQTASIDTNHAERDKHLRSADFFDVDHYPTATFTSTGYEDKGHGKGVLKGKLSLHGVTKNIAIDVDQIGTGPDPWGNYRRGFQGTTTLHLSDYKFLKGGMLGAPAESVELFLSVEGVRK